MINFLEKILSKLHPRKTKNTTDRDILIHRYTKLHGTPPDLENPKKFTEKILHRMIALQEAENIEKITRLADKYQARSYVREKIGDAFLTTVLWHGSDPHQIPFDSLPGEYVIKTNHGSGQIILVKGEADRETITSKLSEWLKNNYYLVDREAQYRDIEPRIIVEEYIHNKAGESPLDFRFWCFNGTPKIIQVDNHAHDINPFFDTQWNKLDFSYREHATRPDIAKPDNLDEMLSVAAKLASGFDFVRVDLYNPDGKILFGEFTFTPVSGRLKFRPESWDMKLGQMWTLSD